MVKVFPSGSKSLDMINVQELDGIGTINPNTNSKDKSLKTEAGSRLVPIHPQLMELGFLDYVGQIRNEKHQKLCPNLKKMRKYR